MATILCVWELGTDLGHLSNLRLPVEIALQQGHRVVMALKELHNVKKIFSDLPIHYLQAPVRPESLNRDHFAIPSYSHLLIRQCFSSVDELVGYLRAWGNIFDLINPHIVLFEHSPTALIAAHHRDFKKVMLGNGFTAPPVQSDLTEPFLPFPTTVRSPEVWQGLQHDDSEVLKLINTALAQLALPGMDCLHAIYGQVDASFLMTWPALDHFGPRRMGQYLGVEPPRPQAQPSWPEGSGPLVFGYMHAFPMLERLLHDLKAQKARAVLFIRHLPAATRQSYTGKGLVFTDTPVDLKKVSSQADWVIGHGNHSTAAHFASQGVPQLLIPLHQEHLFLARKLAEHGCALVAFQDQKSFAEPVSALATDPAYRSRAQHLAQQCGPYETLGAVGHIERNFRLLLAEPM